MGMVVGWIATKGMEHARILEALGLVEAPDASKSKAGICVLPNGWNLIFTTDFGFPTPERMALLSGDGIAIAVSADERTMVSVVRGYERGQAVFTIEHDGGAQGVRHIATAGAVPVEWAPLFAQANREQDKADEAAVEVDHIFDAPLALAEALSGYRHDTEDEEREMIPLTQKKGPGLLSRLFGNRT